MTANKDAWYEDRIRWRIQKHYADSPPFVETAGPALRRVLEATPAVTGKPVVCWGDATRWTVVTTDCVASRHRGEVERCALDAIRDLRPVFAPDDGSHLKTRIRRVRVALDDDPIELWAPEPRDLMALTNLLMMFPLQVPEDEDV